MSKNNDKHSDFNPYLVPYYQDKQQSIEFVTNALESFYQSPMTEIVAGVSGKALISKCAYVVTTTQRMWTESIGIYSGSATWEIDKLIRGGVLVPSNYDVPCPYSGCLARLITSNPIQKEKFKSTNQTKLFEK